MPQKMKILIPLAGGGHLYESRALVEKLGPEFDYVFGVGRKDPKPLSFMPNAAVRYFPGVVNYSTTSPILRAWAAIKSFAVTFWIVLQERPDAVIAVGTANALPALFWGKIFGKKTVFIESITRVADISKTGLLLQRLKLCDRLYVQWPEGKTGNPNVAYQGTVL